MESPGRRFLDGCIVFHGSKSVFYSGQALEGKLNFKLNSPLDISAIYVVYLGEGNVQWIEEQVEMYGGVRRQKFVKYIGREEYFNHMQHLSQGSTVLQAGAHSIPFSYHLPFSCPSSFKGEKGQVTYSVTGYIVHLDGITKDKIETEFEVIDPLNLNTGSADIKNPLVMEFEEQMSCQCLWSSKPLCIGVRLPAQGFTPGQVVPVTVAVRNNTSVEINKIIFQLSTRERYRSQQPPSEYEPPEEVLATLKKGPILSNTNRDYVFEMTVPDFIAPNLENCNIIDVGYFFKVLIKLSGCNEDMDDEAEICIGLVPLGESTDLRHHHLADKLPNGPIPDPDNPINMPPAYQPYTPNQNLPNIQICPPGPIPYPAVANVDAAVMHRSKNSLVGPFEIGFRAPDVNSGVNPSVPRPVPGYPYPAQSPPYATQPSAPSAPPPY